MIRHDEDLYIYTKQVNKVDMTPRIDYVVRFQVIVLEVYQRLRFPGMCPSKLSNK